MSAQHVCDRLAERYGIVAGPRDLPDLVRATFDPATSHLLARFDGGKEHRLVRWRGQVMKLICNADMRFIITVLGPNQKMHSRWRRGR